MGHSIRYATSIKRKYFVFSSTSQYIVSFKGQVIFTDADTYCMRNAVDTPVGGINIARTKYCILQASGCRPQAPGPEAPGPEAPEQRSRLRVDGHTNAMHVGISHVFEFS